MIWYPVAYVVLRATISPMRATVAARDVTQFYQNMLSGFTVSGDAFETGFLPVKSATLTRNSYYRADKLSFTIEGPWAAFDPSVIRSMVVEYYLAGVSGATYAKGQAEILKETAKIKNLQFLGIVDSISETHSDSGLQYRLTARDYTALLSDYVVQPDDLRAVNWKGGMLDAIGQLLSRLPAVQNMHVIVAGQALASQLKSAKVPLPKWAKQYMRKHDRQTFWDLIQDIVLRAGLIAFVDLDRIVIAKPASLYEETAWVDVGKVSPSLSSLKTIPIKKFADRKRPHPYGGTCTMPVWLFGENIAELTREREFGRVMVPTVEVRSLSRKSVVKSQYPKTAPNADRTIRRFVVPGLESDTEAQAVAQQIWEMLARQQMRVSVNTMSLGAFGADDTDPDILEYRAGQPVEILMSKEQVTKDKLIQAGIDEAKARELAHKANAELQNQWYLTEIAYDFNVESGLTISMDLTNYIQVEVVR